MLQYTIEKVIDSQDWDELVTETYGKPYNLQQQDGCMDRCRLRIEVPFRRKPEGFTNTELPFEINGSEMGIDFEVWKATSVEEMNSNFEDSWGGELFWERNFYPALDCLAHDLHAKGLIEAGKYVIVIDW
jgi:hypothetical protein